MQSLESSNNLVFTDAGLELDFSEIDDPAIRIAVRGFVRLMSELWTFLAAPTTKEQAKRTILTIHLLSLFMGYMHEVNKCVEAQAHFAQGVVGCSMVETLLMLVCLKERERVTASQRWRKFARKNAKHGTRMSQLLPWIDLQTLIEIGEELRWFELKAADLQVFLEQEEWKQNEAFTNITPREAIGRMQHFRNGIHPGKLVRTKGFLDEKMSKTTAWLMTLSAAGVLVFAQGDTVDRLILPVHPALRTLIETDMEPVPKGIAAGLFLGVAAACLPSEQGD